LGSTSSFETFRSARDGETIAIVGESAPVDDLAALRLLFPTAKSADR
jgi:hypothetical protein